ncbi:hypothetical protein [Flavobacterium chungangensis]|uniref:Uncharacterized protein n=1 Tax=Flavobacterium chungangensis TaxID=2708132 RepID=A0ABV8ZET1_9FLAO
MDIREATKIVDFLRYKGFNFGMLEDTVVLKLLIDGQCSPNPIVNNRLLPSFSRKLTQFSVRNSYTIYGNTSILATTIVGYSQFRNIFLRENLLKKMYGFGKAL